MNFCDKLKQLFLTQFAGCLSNWTNRLFFILLFFIILSCKSMRSPDLSIACAANMQFVMQDWVDRYEEKTGLNVHLTISSSGKLFAQIREGAPWDLFFSADQKYPRELQLLDIGQEAPKTYATGHLVLLSRQEAIGPDICSWLSEQNLKLALANPQTAPYGAAAQEFLKKCISAKSWEYQLVYGESVSQVNRFFLTGAVDLALTAQSILYSNKLPTACHSKHISDQYYTLIRQDYLRLSDKSAVSDFLDFIHSSSGQQILYQYGYQ